jgi:hypothetical protein
MAKYDVHAVHRDAHAGTTKSAESCGFNHTGRCPEMTGEGMAKCHNCVTNPVYPQDHAKAMERVREPFCASCLNGAHSGDAEEDW